MTSAAVLDPPAQAPARAFTIAERGVVPTVATLIDIRIWWGDCDDPAAPNGSSQRYNIEERRPDGTVHHAPVDGGYLRYIADDDDLMTRINSELRMLYGPHIVLRYGETEADWLDLVDLTRDSN